jgi:acetylornithine deacetylase
MQKFSERINQLLKWVEIDATTGREATYLTTVQSDLESEGWACTQLPVPGCDPAERYNLLATRGHSPRVVLCTHSDTVPPHLPARRRDNAIWGRGACDTKGVFLAMVEAARQLGHPSDLGLLLVIGEEVDHCGAAAFADAPGMEPARIILGEPTLSHVVRGQKGVLKLSLTASGIEGHSAYPDRGESAVHKLLDALGRIRRADLPSHPILGDSTLNVGLISGGVAANVFAPSAQAVLMFRAAVPTADLEAMALEAAGPAVETEVLSRSEPQVFEVPEGFATSVIPFNSDAAWLSRVAPVWLGGPGDIRLAHSVGERITFSEFASGVELYCALYRQA